MFVYRSRVPLSLRVAGVGCYFNIGGDEDGAECNDGAWVRALVSV